MQKPYVLHLHDEPATNKEESRHNETYRQEEEKMMVTEHYDVCELL